MTPPDDAASTHHLDGTGPTAPDGVSLASEQLVVKGHARQAQALAQALARVEELERAAAPLVAAVYETVTIVTAERTGLAPDQWRRICRATRELRDALAADHP